ncbi:MAG: ATP-binding protein [Elusimicrobiota bacterium]
MTAQRQKLLIVDDKAENLLALEKVLQGTGAELVKAASGDAALAASLNHDFAAAILDVQMPGMDGYELAGLLRGERKTRELPIIFLTAVYTDEAHIFKGYETGAVDFITTPFEPSILRSKIEIFLRLAATKEKLEELVIRRTAALEASNRELAAFSYSVSHDLKAPLRAIDGYSLALLEDYEEKLDAKGRQHLHRVRAAAQRMGALIDDLLSLSRVTQKEISRGNTDMSALAQAVAQDLQQADPGRDVEFDIEDGISLNADAGLMKIVLENLMGNAWKFTGKLPKARIQFRATRAEGQMTLVVRDNGVGFDMAHADKLFQAFQRLHRTEDFPGTGIGLATVQRIIARHGGRVWVEAGPGKGAAFFFTIGHKKEASRDWRDDTVYGTGSRSTRAAHRTKPDMGLSKLAQERP